jgi:hypothetical protein
MRGRSRVRLVATVQMAILVAALIGPGSVAAATLGFTLGAPSVSTVQYSDLVTFRGTYTCVNDAVSNCPTTATSRTATFWLRPSGGSAFTSVATVSTSLVFTTDPAGCIATCSVPFQVVWRAGRAGAVPIPPGVYDVRLTTTIAPGVEIISPSGLTITAEDTTTTYTGSTSGLGGDPLALGASIVDFDRGTGVGNGIITPDANLGGASMVTFALYDSTNTTLVVGPVAASLTSGGAVSGSPTLTPPTSGGSFRMRTTYVGNSFYNTSSDLDVVTITPTNTPPSLVLPASPVVAEATSSSGASVGYVVSATDAEDDPDPTPSCSPASGSTFALGSTTVSCTVTDTGGWTITGSFTVQVRDTTAPSVAVGTSEAAAATGWYNAASNDGVPGLTVDVSDDDLVGVVSLVCTDDGVPVGTLAAGGDSFVLGDRSHAVSCTATDGAGNSRTTNASYDVDQTAPSISGALSPTAAGTGWWNALTGAPTVTWTCSDATSGISSCSAPASFGEGAGQSASGSATDLAGNVGTASVSGVNVDLTAPSISGALSSPAAGTGWWNAASGAPTVTWSCGDTASGVVSCSAPSTFGERSAQSASGTAVDAAGNVGTASVSGVNVDLTAPSIAGALSPAAAGTGWWNASTGAPTVTWTCADATSGMSSCSAPATFGEGAGQSASGTAVDLAGNVRTASVSGVNVDLTPPSSVSFVGGGLVDGGSYAYLFVPAGPTGCTATDTRSGVASCSVAGYSTAVGVHVLTATATDIAGNSSTATLTYAVAPWTVIGFNKPIEMDAVNSLKAGNTTQLRFDIVAGSTKVATADAVASLDQVQVTCGTSVPGGSPPPKKKDQTVVDAGGGHLSVRWDSPSLPGTCWLVTVRTIDGSSLSAQFKLK